MANQNSKIRLQEVVLKFPRTWSLLIEFIEFTYNYSKAITPKIGDYRLKYSLSRFDFLVEGREF